MILGIDASNIRKGGGLTHLRSILEESDETTIKFKKVVVWSNVETLNKLPNKSYLVKKTHPHLNKSNLQSFFFQLFYISKMARKEKCTLMFVPGGTFIGPFSPFVTMSQNMLPFEYEEAKYYELKMRVRLAVLYLTQTFSFKRSKGLIFLTQYAEKYISGKIKFGKHTEVIKIPHGVDFSFLQQPKEQKESSYYTKDNPYKILYVSYVTVYKHHWNLVQAVCELLKENIPIELTLIGGILDSYEKVESVLQNNKEVSGHIKYMGNIEHGDLLKFYQDSDAFVFASSCENMPIILIEAMSVGLPIASSNSGPMSEVLGDAGVYFNPRKVQEIKKAIMILFLDKSLREEVAKKAYSKALDYTWKNCSEDTFKFLYKIANKEKDISGKSR